MRLLAVILALGAMAIALVHIRRAEIGAAHETQVLRAEQVRLRRVLWDQQVELGRLTAPGQVQRRAEEMSLGLTEKGRGRDSVAGR